MTFRYFTILPDRPRPGRKTLTYRVINKHSGNQIGSIKWYGPWRKYCFFPVGNTVWSNDCLVDICNAMKGL